MQIFDISMPISMAIQRWPGSPPVILEGKQVGSSYTTMLSMGLHTSTHIDFPYHFIPQGKRQDDYTLDRFIGMTRVIEIESSTTIRVRDLVNKKINQVDKILFKTRNSKLWGENDFSTDFVGLDNDAAQYLVDCGVKLVGIDYLSIQPYDAVDDSVHNILLNNDVLILEGINLCNIEAGNYHLYCCPLNIVGVEASPVRALLISQSFQLEL